MIQYGQREDEENDKERVSLSCVSSPLRGSAQAKSRSYPRGRRNREGIVIRAIPRAATRKSLSLPRGPPDKEGSLVYSAWVHPI